jgi:hypothetical protein
MRLSGWKRLFIVLSLVAGAYCFYEGAEAYRQENISIYESSRAIVVGSPNGQLPQLSKDILNFNLKRQEANAKNQLITYGGKWVVWSVLIALLLAAIRFIVAGFKKAD